MDSTEQATTKKSQAMAGGINCPAGLAPDYPHKVCRNCGRQIMLVRRSRRSRSHWQHMGERARAVPFLGDRAMTALHAFLSLSKQRGSHHLGRLILSEYRIGLVVDETIDIRFRWQCDLLHEVSRDGAIQTERN